MDSSAEEKLGNTVKVENIHSLSINESDQLLDFAILEIFMEKQFFFFLSENFHENYRGQYGVEKEALLSGEGGVII